MRFLHCFMLLVLATAAVITAGCTQGTTPPPSATPIPVTAAVSTPAGLPALALGPADLPSCFLPTGQHTKTAAEVGSLAKDLGWQAGYEASFACPAAGGREPDVIVQSIAIYPPANLAAIAGMVYRQDRVAGYTYENLTGTDISVAGAK